MHKESYEARPPGNIQSLAPCPWYKTGDYRPHFIFTLESGAFEVNITEDWKMVQNYFNEIINDLDIKHLVWTNED